MQCHLPPHHTTHHWSWIIAVLYTSSPCIHTVFTSIIRITAAWITMSFVIWNKCHGIPDAVKAILTWCWLQNNLLSFLQSRSTLLHHKVQSDRPSNHFCWKMAHLLWAHKEVMYLSSAIFQTEPKITHPCFIFSYSDSIKMIGWQWVLWCDVDLTTRFRHIWLNHIRFSGLILQWATVVWSTTVGSRNAATKQNLTLVWLLWFNRCLDTSGQWSTDFIVFFRQWESMDAILADNCTHMLPVATCCNLDSWDHFALDRHTFQVKFKNLLFGLRF